jgi:hypothetical protein
MTFLNPYILFALFGIVIPILLHLFNLKKIKRVEFSTLMFLKEIQKSKLRKIKIRQLLLLVLRVLIIIFLVLSFSNPVIKGYNFGNPDLKKSCLIFLDDSYSMNTKDEKGIYLDRAKINVEEILKYYKPTDRVSVVPNSYIGMADKGVLDASSGDIIDSIRNVKSSFIPFRLSRIIKYSDNFAEQDSYTRNEIFIVSDFQKINCDNSSSLKIKNISNDNTYLYAVNIGKREANNLSVENVNIKSKLLQKNKKINLSVRVKNFNNKLAFNKQVNLFIEGEKVSENVLDIPSYESKDIDFSFRVNKTGSISGYAELLQNDFNDDEILQDNKYYFSIYIPDVFNIKIVNENASGSNYIKTAIEIANNSEKDSTDRGYKRYNIFEDNYVSADIKNFDVLILNGKKDFSESEIELIKDYIDGGKGIFIFPDKNINIDSYNSLLAKFNAFRINGIINPDETNSKNIKFGRIDFEHPLLSGIFKNESLSITTGNNIDAPSIKSFYDISSNEKSFPVISLTNEKPFLIECNLIRGKIILSSVSASGDMSDFPVKPLFAPVIIKGIEYLSNSSFEQHNDFVGDNIILFTKGLNNISYLSSPDGIKYPYKYNLYNNREMQNYNVILLKYISAVSQTGKYIFRDLSDNSFFSFSLNSDTIESNMQKNSKQEIYDYFKGIGIKNVNYINNQSDIKSELAENRNGSELWKYFLSVAFILLILELIYSKRLEKI